MRDHFDSCLMALFINLCFVNADCYAADLQLGQALHDEECLICHDSSVYTHENRRARTLEELMARVNLCQQDVGAEWNSAQLDAVVAYLNESFYKFTKGAPTAH